MTYCQLPISDFRLDPLAKGQLAIANLQWAILIGRYRSRTVPSGCDPCFGRYRPHRILLIVGLAH